MKNDSLPAFYLCVRVIPGVYSVYFRLYYSPRVGCEPYPALVQRWDDSRSVGASPGSDQASKNQITLFSPIGEISKVNSIRTDSTLFS